MLENAKLEKAKESNTIADIAKMAANMANEDENHTHNLEEVGEIKVHETIQDDEQEIESEVVHVEEDKSMNQKDDLEKEVNQEVVRVTETEKEIETKIVYDNDTNSSQSEKKDKGLMSTSSWFNKELRKLIHITPKGWELRG